MMVKLFAKFKLHFEGFEADEEGKGEVAEPI